MLTEHSSEPPSWRKSARCGTAACVEVLTDRAFVGMRSSLAPQGPALSFSHDAWADFVVGIKAGEFDLH
ncbi:MAG: DUF397 domain-containing protein [Actinomycetota bacterium]|nr:DUF397 domain-containing protein [Actinomycetota bacterium]